MYYIYSLSIQEKVFYVGCSLYPIKRYSHHLTGCNRTTRYIIYRSLLKGVLPCVKIHYHSRHSDVAFKKEAYLIKEFAENGVKLVNITHNPKRNRLNVNEPSMFNKKYYINKIYDAQVKAELIEYANKNLLKKPARSVIWDGTFYY